MPNSLSCRRRMAIELLESRRLLDGKLSITEINYHPHAPTPDELAVDAALVEADFEFVELRNTGDAPLDLAGHQFTESIAFDFSSLADTTLAPADFLLLVRNPVGFAARYGAAVAIDGQFTGELDNGGATLLIADAAATTVVDMTYDNGGKWPRLAAGRGSALVLVDPDDDLDDPDNFRASVEFGGSPGAAGLAEMGGRVVVNEVLANSNDLVGEVDTIELLNVSSQQVDLAGWALTDDAQDFHLRWYTIPAGTTLDPGEYLVLDEAQFNADGSGPEGFAVSSTGDGVMLLATAAAGSLVREDYVRLGPSPESISIGRSPNGTGELVALAEQTFGDENAEPLLGRVIISEIMYNPGDGLTTGGEYVEVFNRTDEPIDLSNWQLTRNDPIFTFPEGTMLAADAAMLVADVDPADAVAVDAFRQWYAIDPATDVFGPLSDNLPNGGGLLEVTAAEPTGVPGEFNMIPIDTVDYDDSTPWPEGPDRPDDFAGAGGTALYSLTRNTTEGLSQDPHAWTGAHPTPGQWVAPSTASHLDGLVISELMYAPPSGDGAHEYVELLNTNGVPLDLTGTRLDLGVEFAPPDGTHIGPGQTLVIVSFDPAAPEDAALLADFMATYALTAGQETPLLGDFDGRLSNGGEDLALVDAIGNTPLDFRYDNADDFPTEPASGGDSLALIAPADVPTTPAARFTYLSDGSHWQAAAPTPTATDFVAPPNPWRNPTNELDVDNDTTVVPLDALLVINRLNSTGSGLLPAVPGEQFAPPYLDVSGDGFVSPIDALLVINHLNEKAASGGEGEPVATPLETIEPAARPQGHDPAVPSAVPQGARVVTRANPPVLLDMVFAVFASQRGRLRHEAAVNVESGPDSVGLETIALLSPFGLLW